MTRLDAAARRIDLEVPMDELALCETDEAGQPGCSGAEVSRGPR